MTDEFGREENTYGQDPAYPVMTAETIHSEAEAAELEQLYAQLKPEAIAEARKYVLARTPAKFQQDMADLIATDFPPPPDPPEARIGRRPLNAPERLRPDEHPTIHDAAL